MAKVHSRSLVIDADIAQAAGPEDATHPTAKHCRDFLLAVADICHRATFSATIAEEWNNHQSGFARRWRRSMFARKKIDSVDVPAVASLRAAIENAAPGEKQREAMLKDVHLIEAALATDMRIVSRDNVRECFKSVAGSIAPLRKVCWINPDDLNENPLEWLRTGAPTDGFRKLGHVPPDE